jgi:hypothetical protein
VSDAVVAQVQLHDVFDQRRHGPSGCPPLPGHEHVVVLVLAHAHGSHDEEIYCQGLEQARRGQVPEPEPGLGVKGFEHDQVHIWIPPHVGYGQQVIHLRPASGHGDRHPIRHVSHEPKRQTAVRLQRSCG